jgi:hypothetical protein
MHNPIVSIKNKPPIPYKNEGGINSISPIPLAKSTKPTSHQQMNPLLNHEIG